MASLSEDTVRNGIDHDPDRLLNRCIEVRHVDIGTIVGNRDKQAPRSADADVRQSMLAG